MTNKEAEKYADNMTYRDAINNLMKARSIPYRKATFIKINELLKALEQQPSEDTISRQTALEPYQTLDDSDVISVWMIRKNIEQIPSVTPQRKTGTWVRTTDAAGREVWECDKCGWQQRFANNYCPDCGAIMMNVI